MPWIERSLSMVLHTIDARTFVFYLALLILASYIAGRIYGSIRVNKLRVNIAPVLERLGSKPRIHAAGSRMLTFSGSSLGKLIGQYSLTIFLLGRENPLNWLIARAAGRGDMVILRCRVKGDVRHEVDVIRKGTSPYKRLAKKRVEGVVKDLGDTVAIILSQHDNGYEAVDKAVEILKNVSGLWSFSLRHEMPELIVTFSPKNLEAELEQAIKTVNDSVRFLVSRP